MFALHSQLASDTFLVGDLPLSRLLLMDDRRFPWLILVPRRVDTREWFDLSPEEDRLLGQELRQVARAWATHTQADKINIAALGNQVPQLHVHVIARFVQDAAWPNPVWSAPVPRQRYDAKTRDAQLSALRHITNL